MNARSRSAWPKQLSKPPRLPNTSRFVGFAANVTQVGPQWRNYLEARRDTLDFMAVAETHLDGKASLEEQTRLHGRGWTSFWTPARSTGKGGTSGGTAIVASATVQVAHLFQAATEATSSFTARCDQLVDVTPVIVRMKELEILIVAAYLTVGQGLRGQDNASKLECLAALVSACGLPWIIIGDMNADPDEMRGSDWLRYVDGRVVLPSNSLVTCTAGSVGSLIDYAIVSAGLERLVSLKADFSVPWQPHAGLTFEVAVEANAGSTRILRSPYCPVLPQLRFPERDLGGSDPMRNWDIARRDVARGANANKGGSVVDRRPHVTKISGASLLSLTQRDAISGSYATLMRTMEVYWARKADQVKDLAKLSTRARGPLFQVTSVRRNLVRPRVQAESARLVGWWAVFTTLWQSFKIELRRGFHGRRDERWHLLRKHWCERPDMQEDFLDGLRDAASWDCLLEPSSHCPLPLAEAAQRHAEETHQKARALDITSRRQDFRRWIVSQLETQRCKGFYRWTRPKDAPSCGGILSGAYGGALLTEPLALAHHFRTVFRSWWCRREGAGLQTFEALKELRAHAAMQPLAAYTFEDADRALFSLKDDTGQGLDRLGPRVLKSLPLDARMAFVELFRKIESGLLWPWQMLAAKVVLIAKADGGCRPIALLMMLYRWFLRIHRVHTRRWTADKAAFWDHAIASSSALRSATLTALRVEMAELAGFDWAVVLWDLTKFYDTVDLAALSRAVVSRAYPSRIAYLCLTMYQAPRVLFAHGSYSQWIAPQDSMLPGCGEAVNLARCVLFDILEAVSQSSPLDQLGQFVDDVKMFATGHSNLDLIDSLAPAVRTFVKGVENASLVISAKSKVVGTSPMVNQYLSHVAGVSGAKLREARNSTDLGVDIHSSRRRLLPKRKSRTSVADLQNSKVLQLKHKRAGRRIYATAVRTRQNYDLPLFGVAPTVLAKRRAAAAKHLGWRPGMCTTTLYEIERPSGFADPMVAEPCATIDAYLSLWLRSPELRQDIAQAWNEAADTLKSVAPSQRWKMSKGILSATITTLLQEGWEPTAADLWTDPGGTSFQLSDAPSDRRFFTAHFASGIRKRLWARAGAHHLSGLHEEMDTTAAAKLVKRLRKQGHLREAQLASMIACGGLWTRTRAKEAGYAVPTENVVCPLCGCGQDTLFHRAYQCRRVLDISAGDLHSTRALASVAQEDNALIWCRGLVPTSLLDIPPPCSRPTIRCHGAARLVGGNKLFAGNHTFYLDESGGARASDPRLRRCGWGVAILPSSETDTTFCGGWAGSLAGAVQTPTRACLAGFVHLLANTEGPLVVYPDAKYLVQGFANFRHRHPDGTHADLWASIGELVSSRGASVEVHKTTAHLDEAHAIANPLVNLHQWIGNHLADALAGQAASFDAVPTEVACGVDSLTGRAYNILRRLVAACALFLEERGESEGFVRPPRPAGLPSSLQLLIRSSGHDFGIEPRTVKEAPPLLACKCCGQIVAKANLVATLRDGGACVPLRILAAHHGADDLFAPQQGQLVRAARSDLHRSHCLLRQRGIWFCSTCGGYTGSSSSKTHPLSLRSPCKPPTRAGKYHLSRLSKGLTPTPSVSWPDPLGEAGHLLVPRRRVLVKTTLIAPEFAPLVANDGRDQNMVAGQQWNDGADSELSDGEEVERPLELQETIHFEDGLQDDEDFLEEQAMLGFDAA